MAGNIFIKNKYITPLLLALLAAIAWFAWSWFPILTINKLEPSPGNNEILRRNVYFGPWNSIAVLPFAGRSDEPEQLFWSEGFSSELISLFIRVPQLQVTSRTSSFFFRETGLQAVVVGERLQTSHLLTGEFLLVDGRVRVAARLTDTRMNDEIWSESFEGDLVEVFAIQDEILASALEAMQFEHTGRLPLVDVVDTNAWSAYLQGLYYSELKSPEALQRAEQAFLAAVEIEPGYEAASFGLAQALLASARVGQGDELDASGPAGPPVSLTRARAALQAVLGRNPDSADALGLLSYVRRTIDWDWEGALQAASQALDQRPGDAQLMSTASLALFSLGRFEKAGRLLETSIERDPLNLASRLRLGLLREFAGDYDSALSTYRTVAGMNPEFPGIHAYRARVKILQDKADSALLESEKETQAFWNRYARILALSALDRQEEALPLLDRMISEDGEEAAYQIAEILAFRGDTEQSFQWLQRAREQKDGGMAELVGNRFFANLHSDPRWEELLRGLGLPLD